jgi:uncharacterized protein (TIGR03435 family)
MNPTRLVVVLAATLGLVQSQNVTPRSEFEVATIKLTANHDGRSYVQVLPGGGLRVSGATLKGLLASAYQVRSFQISSGPGWIDSEHFDVIGKADRSAGSEDQPGDLRQVSERQYQTRQEQMRPKLQALLADRFQLRLHREMREQPVYVLVVSKSGTRLRQSAEFRGLRVGGGQLIGNGATLEMLTTALAGQLGGRSVLDRTELKGAFEFKLEWTPDRGDSGPPSQGVEVPLAAPPTGPSLFTALEEQLGLRLESAKGPVEFLVIDHVERPSGN